MSFHNTVKKHNSKEKSNWKIEQHLKDPREKNNHKKSKQLRVITRRREKRNLIKNEEAEQNSNNSIKVTFFPK